MKYTKKYHTLSEAGIASIMVTMVMMLIISLIVLGFAEIARREQRQSLDRELSTQAFYAAESGVNDALSALQVNSTVGKTNCAPYPFGGSPYGSLLGPGSNQLSGQATSYTCLLINPAPPFLKTSAGINQPTVVPIKTTSPINKMTISWQDTSNGTNFSCPLPVGTFPPAAVAGANNWPCDPGMLRIDLVPADGNPGGELDATNLAKHTLTAFLEPESGGAVPTISYNPANPTNTGLVQAGSCNSSNTYYCQVTIQFNPVTPHTYYLQLRSIYNPNDVKITATDSGGTTLNLQGAEALIDSTGKAQDELRRIQEFVSLTPTSALPAFAIQTTQGICKEFAVAPNGFYQNDANNNNNANDCPGIPY